MNRKNHIHKVLTVFLITSIICYIVLFNTHSSYGKNLKGQTLTVETELGIACFSTGWLEQVVTCSKVGNWLDDCKGGNLERELFKPISPVINDPRCIKLYKGDAVKVVEIDSQNKNYLWVESNINTNFKWWTLKQFFLP